MSQTNGETPVIKAAEERKDPTPAEQMAKFTGESTVKDETPAEKLEAVEDKKEKPVEEPKEEASTDDSEESGADAPEGEEKPKKKKTVEERIAELTAKRRDAERESASKDDTIADLQRQIDELKGKKPEEDLTTEKRDPKSEIKPPNPDDFEYGEFDTKYREAYSEYQDKLVDAKVQSRLDAERKKDVEARQADAADAKRQELGAKLLEHEKAGIKEFDDFEDALSALEDIKTPIAAETTEALLESEHAHKILYHLGKNPKEAAEMASQSPLKQAQYLGRLEAKFSAEAAAKSEKPKPKTSKAPEPPSRSRGANGQFQGDDATTDFKAFRERHSGKGF